MTVLLCDPGWYVHKPDAQNKWDGNRHTHTYTGGLHAVVVAGYGNLINTNTHASSRSTPVAQSAPRNLLTRWDVSSIPANGIFLTKN